MIDRNDAFAILDTVMEKSGADSVSASITGGLDASTRLADNIATQCLRRDDLSLHLTCAFGRRHASVSTNNLRPEAVREALSRAEDAARLSPPDPEFMQPVTADEAQRYPDIEAWCAATAERGPETTAAALAAAVEPVRRAGYRLSGAFRHSASFHALANSTGLRAYHRFTRVSFHATCLGDNGTGWAQACATSANNIAVEDVAREALDIAVQAQNPTPIEPGPYTVILRPAAVADMLPWSMVQDAKATDEGRTFLRGRLHTRVASPMITLRSDPTDPRLPAGPFLGNGLAADKVDWIRQGILENLVRSRYWAAKTGTEPSRGPTNLILDGGDSTLESMIAGTERGILVTRFWYIRVVDPMTSLLTGMTRDGLFLIENGRVTRPLTQLRFNEKVLGVLDRVEEIGPVEQVGAMLVPPLKVRDFTFSSSTTF